MKRDWPRPWPRALPMLTAIIRGVRPRGSACSPAASPEASRIASKAKWQEPAAPAADIRGVMPEALRERTKLGSRRAKSRAAQAEETAA